MPRPRTPTSQLLFPSPMTKRAENQLGRSKGGRPGCICSMTLKTWSQKVVVSSTTGSTWKTSPFTDSATRLTHRPLGLIRFSRQVG